MRTGKVLLSLIAGFASGAVLGSLLTPAKRSETRGKKLARGNDNADSVKKNSIN